MGLSYTIWTGIAFPYNIDLYLINLFHISEIQQR